MTEPRKVHIVRPHQTVTEYAYERGPNTPENTFDHMLLERKDYRALGWRRVTAIQSLPLNDSWPITVGNAVATFSSGFLGPFITKCLMRCVQR